MYGIGMEKEGIGMEWVWNRYGIAME